MAKRRVEDVSLDMDPDNIKPRGKSWGLPKRRRCLDLNVRTLFYFGLWLAEGRERRGPLFYWRYFFPRVQLIRMTYSIIFQAINISLVWGKSSLMAEYSIMLAIYSMALVKCITVFIYQDKLREMARTLEKLYSPRHAVQKDLKIVMNKTNCSAQNMTKYCFSIGLTLVIIVSIGLVIQGFIKRTLPFKRWFPYDAYSSPAFEITLIGSYVFPPFDLFLIFMVDTLFIALTMHIVGQFEVLKQKLSHVRVNVETTTKTKGHLASLSECLRPKPRSKEVSSRLQSYQTNGRYDRGVRSEESNGVLGKLRKLEKPTNTYRKIVSVGTLPKLQKNKLLASNLVGRKRSTRSRNLADEISVMAMQTNQMETILQMECYLNKCVKEHQQLMLLCSQLAQVFKLMLNCQVFCNIMCGIFVLYVTTLARYVDVKVITAFMSVVVCYLQYFLYCWYGNRITEESVNVRDAVYDCDWFGASESFKRSMRIVILRTNKPIIIRAGGLPLSMRTFKKIYKAAYYLNMILSKLFHGEKIIQSKM